MGAELAARFNEAGYGSQSAMSWAVFSRDKVEMISRPQLPKPITPHPTWNGTRVSKSAAWTGARLINSTPPSMAIKVAKEPPLRKSRRFNSAVSFVFIRDRFISPEIQGRQS